MLLLKDVYKRQVIKVADDFYIEITQLATNTIINSDLTLAATTVGPLNWDECDSEKTNNIKRKVRAITGMNDDSNQEDVNEIVDMYVKAYLSGLNILNNYRVLFPEVYEDIYNLEKAYKKDVAFKTKMNGNKSMNSDVLQGILSDFEIKLEKACPYLSLEVILELKDDLIAGWLADCSMEFRS